MQIASDMELSQSLCFIDCLLQATIQMQHFVAASKTSGKKMNYKKMNYV